MNPLSTIRGPHGLGRSEGEGSAQGYACDAGSPVDPGPKLSEQDFADFFASIGVTFNAQPCDDGTLKSLRGLCHSVMEAPPVNPFGPQGSPATQDAILSPNVADFAAQDTPELCSASTPASALSHHGSPFSSASCPFSVDLESSQNRHFFTQTPQQQLESPILLGSAPTYGAMPETVVLSTNTPLSSIAIQPGVDQTELATTEARYEPTSSDGAPSPSESSTDRPFRCTMCTYKAKTNRELNRHVKSIHADGPVELRCVECDAKFKGDRDDNLRRHVRKKHGFELPSKLKGPPKGSRRAPRRPKPAQRTNG
jgi:uncharacterized C2H2 Zn-finger protein